MDRYNLRDEEERWYSKYEGHNPLHEPMVEHIDHRHDKEYRPLERFEFDWHDTTAPYYEDTYHYYGQPLEQYHYIPEDDYLQEQKEQKATHSKQEPEPQEPASTDKKSGKKDKSHKNKKA